jgi:CHASE2 domain-containing sensor protein
MIASAAGSSAFAALIWWIVPITALIGALGYVLWVSKLKSKYETETSRSVNQFQKFQDSFRADNSETP